jgi:hypothetical protein
VNIQISAGALDTLARGLREAPQLYEQVMLPVMTQVTQGLQGDVTDAFPAASGLTRSSISSDVFSTPAGVLGVVGSSAPAAVFVELGTKPHMPPIEALITWVRAVLGVEPKRAKSVAFLVARKIAKKGTRAQLPFAKTLAAQQGEIVRAFENAAADLAQRMAGELA